MEGRVGRKTESLGTPNTNAPHSTLYKNLTVSVTVRVVLVGTNKTSSHGLPFQRGDVLGRSPWLVVQVARVRIHSVSLARISLARAILG